MQVDLKIFFLFVTKFDNFFLIFFSSFFKCQPSHCLDINLKDQKPFLLMHSRHARNLYNSKIKMIFEIAWTLFEIILFIHFYSLNKHLDGARSTLNINFLKGLIFITSNEYIWPHKNSIFMHGVKSTTFSIYQKVPSKYLF